MPESNSPVIRDPDGATTLVSGGPVFRSRPGSRSTPARQAWAARILLSHRAEDGWCIRCMSVYGAKVPWPCRAAQVASLYSQGPVLEPDDESDEP